MRTRARRFNRYLGYYLTTSGQVYWSDEHVYPDDYRRALDPLLKSARATEMITEFYVPREKQADFMSAAGEELRRRNANPIYGTVRLIERDDETTLASVVQHLHVTIHQYWFDSNDLYHVIQMVALWMLYRAGTMRAHA